MARVRLLFLVCLAGGLSFLPQVQAQPTPAENPIRLPIVGPSGGLIQPNARIRLTRGVSYVIDSKVECILRDHPSGKLDIKEKKGPRDITAIFIDSEKPGVEEDREYKGPFIYIVRAATGKGDVDLDIIPVGIKTRSQIVAVPFDVDSGLGPQPPPGPVVDPVVPKPPVVDPVQPTAKKVTVVVCEVPQNRTPTDAKVINDPDVRAKLTAGGHKIVTLSVNDPAFEEMGYRPFCNRVGYPAVLVFDQEAKGQQIPLHSFLLPNTGEKFGSEIWKAVTK